MRVRLLFGSRGRFLALESWLPREEREREREGERERETEDGSGTFNHGKNNRGPDSRSDNLFPVKRGTEFVDH